MQIPFSFVDVFAEKPLSGNPLAIIPHAEALEDATMQRIVGELNQAETTFILPAAQGTIRSEHGGGWRNRGS